MPTMTEAEIINREHYQNIAFLLNHHAYIQQIKKKGAPLKQFIPCQKALVFTSAMGQVPIPVTSVVIQDAGHTRCSCHPNTGEDYLWNKLEYVKKNFKGTKLVIADQLEPTP